jgi:hypothetical protein
MLFKNAMAKNPKVILVSSNSYRCHITHSDQKGTYGMVSNVLTPVRKDIYVE